MSESIIQGTPLVATIITNSIGRSISFYQDGLKYSVLKRGVLNDRQREVYGSHLSEFVLLGHDSGSIVRLINHDSPDARPIRMCAKPWDIGLCVMEVGAADVEKAYYRLIRNRFGVISPPKEFSVTGPEPLGHVVMKAFGALGPAGEQLFITQITHREGGTPLWKQRKDINVFPPGNIVLSLADREPQKFYERAFNLYPAIDLPLAQEDAAYIMGGPSDMSFRMCLMGNGSYKSGMEQHCYAEMNPTYSFTISVSNLASQVADRPKGQN